MNATVTPPIRRKNPLLLALACVLLGPGAPILWLGKWRLAILYFILPFVVLIGFFLATQRGLVTPLSGQGFSLTAVARIVTAPIFLLGLLHGLCLNRSGDDASPWYSRWYFALPVFPLVAAAISFTIGKNFYQPIAIPSESMAPNYVTGDYAFSALGQKFKHGDVVTFKKPNALYVSRIVGMPGDGVQLIKGILHINGKPVAREKLNATQYLERHSETLAFKITELDDAQISDNTEFFQVPEGHYFMMGDNRDNSMDSRFEEIGFIPAADILGTVGRPYWNAL